MGGKTENRSSSHVRDMRAAWLRCAPAFIRGCVGKKDILDAKTGMLEAAALDGGEAGGRWQSGGEGGLMSGEKRAVDEGRKGRCVWEQPLPRRKSRQIPIFQLRSTGARRRASIRGN